MSDLVVAADALAGECVVDEKGDEVGRVVEVMIDVPCGRVAYAVIGAGGVFGIGERLLAVPWSALSIAADGGSLVLPRVRADLDRAPAFDEDHWPAMGDPAWARQIHEFYGTAPY
jgi:sporulation protein YlmC with PRC-barrel domain